MSPPGPAPAADRTIIDRVSLSGDAEARSGSDLLSEQEHDAEEYEQDKEGAGDDPPQDS